MTPNIHSKECSICGVLAEFEVVQDGETNWLCKTCVQWFEPIPGISRLLSAFQRPNKLVSECPYCGWKAGQVELEGKVGCPLCYDSLDAGLLVRMREAGLKAS